MTDFDNPQREIEPHLLREIEMLRSTPERDPAAVEQGRQAFLAELDSVPELNDRSTVSWLTGFFNRKSNHKENIPVKTHTQRFAFTTAVVIITILVLLFGGAGATAYAAQSALPGDALYSIKTGMEQTRVILARDAYAEAQLYLSFAQLRLDEMAELIRQGRYGDVELASSEFEQYVQKAIGALGTVMAGDPERGSLLSSQITHTLLSYGAVLKQVLASVPEAVRPAVEKAILTSESSAGEEVEITGVVESITDSVIVVSGQTIEIIDATDIEDGVSVGDQVKVEAIVGSDGTFTASEIEFSGSDIEGNGDNDANDNDDDNGNDNEDDNANDNDDDNANDNDDDNANDDDNDNANDNDDDDANDDDDDNGNDNEDDNANDNGDDDDNGNDNDDDNDNEDDNTNDNDNDDDDENDNGDDDSGNDNGDEEENDD